MAYATLVFEDSFLVSGIKIIWKSDGRMGVIMPSKRSSKGKLHSVCHPITKDFNSYIEEKIYGELEQRASNFDALRSPRGLDLRVEHLLSKNSNEKNVETINNGDIGVPTISQ